MPELTIIEFARMGGKASVKSRFTGKTKKEISQIMREVRTKQYENENCSNKISETSKNVA